MSEYIITKKQIEELNKAHGGMEIITSWLSCYAIWDTSNTYPVMKSEHVAIDLPEIVRCRDCKYFTTNIHGSYCTKSITTLYSPDGYCAWAERRTDE